MHLCQPKQNHALIKGAYLSTCVIISTTKYNSKLDSLIYEEVKWYKSEAASYPKIRIYRPPKDIINHYQTFIDESNQAISQLGESYIVTVLFVETLTLIFLNYLTEKSYRPGAIL